MPLVWGGGAVDGDVGSVGLALVACGGGLPWLFKRGEEVASRFCMTALNWSFSAFSTGKNYLMVNSRARYDTELLKDVQQVITEKLVSVPQQPPHIGMLPQEKNLATFRELC